MPRPVKRGMKPFTILLLYPDYIADNYGHETYLAHAYGSSVENAILHARIEARDASDAELDDLDDFHVLAVFEGLLRDLS